MSEWKSVHGCILFPVKWLSCCLQACILGEETEEKLKYKCAEEGLSPPPSMEESQRGRINSALKLVWCALGLQVSYLTWGVLQERIMTQKYDGDVFSNSQFLVFVNRILALLLAGDNAISLLILYGRTNVT